MHYAQVYYCIPFPKNNLEHPIPSIHLGLIAFHIWRTSQQIYDTRMGGDLKCILMIIIESGLYGITCHYSYMYLIVLGVAYVIVLTCEVATFTVHLYFFNLFLNMVGLTASF